jgi:hypothetical protein
VEAEVIASLKEELETQVDEKWEEWVKMIFKK